MNHMKNQISALNDPFPSLDDLLKSCFGVGGSWLKYLLLIPLMLLTIVFVFYLFIKIFVSRMTECMTEPPMKIMMTRLDIYMINDCNSVTLDMGRCNKK